jgi:pimeloyl-ACP methyl ester carboxylesterase
VDYRGDGRSEAINCRPLQQIETSDPAAVQRAVGACGVQLGDAANDYSAADVADDVDAVRAALGYPLINFYGQSRPAKRRSTGADRSRRIDRRVAAVAWLTIQDALRLNGIVPKATVRGVGLRGGRSLGSSIRRAAS